MRIKRFKLRDNINIADIKAFGGSGGGKFVNKDAEWCIHKCFYYKPTDFEFSITIVFKLDLKDWNDFDCILVLDEAFAQSYTPFYDYFDKEIDGFKVLQHCVKTYNDYLSKLPFLIEVNE